MLKDGEIAEIEQQVETLEKEVKKFADRLPYWAKYLAKNILSGSAISDVDNDASYSKHKGSGDNDNSSSQSYHRLETDKNFGIWF